MTPKDKKLILGIANSIIDFKKEIRASVDGIRTEVNALKNAGARIDIIAGHKIAFDFKVTGLITPDAKAEVSAYLQELSKSMSRHGIQEGEIKFTK